MAVAGGGRVSYAVCSGSRGGCPAISRNRWAVGKGVSRLVLVVEPPTQGVEVSRAGTRTD